MELPPTIGAGIGMMAAQQADQGSALAGFAARNAALVRRLHKFSFPKVAKPLAGLLVLPENNVAARRLEGLIHLAAAFCNGDRAPTVALLREWLNEIILKDPIAQLEDPVEDVCVTNVVSWIGNSRLIDGNWPDNDHSLQGIIVCAVQLRNEEWMKPAEAPIRALLRMTEAVAERAGIPRFALTRSPPRQALRLGGNTITAAAEYIEFTPSELIAMSIRRSDLLPFEFSPELRAELIGQTIGNTALERRPIVFSEGKTLLILPTAVSAAIRRLVMETAHAAGEIAVLQETLSRYQFELIVRLGLIEWGIRELDVSEPPADYELIGMFDEGGYVHFVFVPDSLEEILQDGLRSFDEIPDAFTDKLDKIAHEIARRPDYQRGMTFLVHGGSGRAFAASFGEPPSHWQRLILGVSDFMLLARDTDMDALRAWKLLDQEDDLRRRGIQVSNPNGFMNLYGYAKSQNFEIVPNAMTQGILWLQTDYLTEVRHHLRTMIDQHAAFMTNSPGYLSVQRQTTSGFFEQVQNLPIYISAEHAATGKLIGCVETATRPWWVRCDERTRDARASSAVYKLWELVHSWLVRAAPRLEAALPGLPTRSVVTWLKFSEIESFTSRQGERVDRPIPPEVAIENGEIVITCSVDYLRSFASEKNTGDRLMVAALVRGAHALVSVPLSDDGVEKLVSAIVPNEGARFFHAIPAMLPRDRLFAVLNEARPRFVQPEDRAITWLNLASEAGWTEGSSEVPNADARKLLNNSANVVWLRVKDRLRTLDRASVVERAVRNDYSISRDRSSWHMTAAALLSLYDDQAEIIAAANRREGQRGVAALASRVVAEMAICVSPLEGGKVCSNAELDFLVANVATLLECASQSDAIHFNLATKNLVIEPNGTYTFDPTFRDTLHLPYILTHGERGFRAAAAGYGSPFEEREREPRTIDPDFDKAFSEEFGLSPPQLSAFTYRLADISVRDRVSTYQLKRSEVEEHLKEVGVLDTRRAFNALSLKPRANWDEKKPLNAEPKDWYPWRFNRRLSLTRRPLPQLDESSDPLVLIAPAHIDRSVEYLYGTYEGRFPVDLFESTAMRSWIGHAVNRDGHAFNQQVAAAFGELGFSARSDVKMTELGGTQGLGDVDALAWQPETGVIFAAECKRLLFARTVAEVGERLREYTSIAAPGDDRTPIQKHADRMTFLKSALPAVAKLTGIAESKIVLRSALVTDYLVPMQFSKEVSKFVDVVTDLSLLGEAVKT